MDFPAFRKWLRYTRTDDLADKYLQTAKSFAEYLAEETPRSLLTATPNDLAGFEQTQDRSQKARHWRCRHLDALYRFLKHEQMLEAVRKLGAQSIAPASLHLFRSVPLSHRRALAQQGIETNLQLLEACKTQIGIMNLTSQTGISTEELDSLLQLSDLRRLVGLRRAGMLFEANIRSVRVIASMAPEETRSMVALKSSL